MESCLQYIAFTRDYGDDAAHRAPPPATGYHFEVSIYAAVIAYHALSHYQLPHALTQACRECRLGADGYRQVNGFVDYFFSSDVDITFELLAIARHVR